MAEPYPGTLCKKCGVRGEGNTCRDCWQQEHDAKTRDTLFQVIGMARGAVHLGETGTLLHTMRQIAEIPLPGEDYCDQCKKPFAKPGFEIKRGDETGLLCGWECLREAAATHSLKSRKVSHE